MQSTMHRDYTGGRRPTRVPRHQCTPPSPRKRSERLRSHSLPHPRLQGHLRARAFLSHPLGCSHPLPSMIPGCLFPYHTASVLRESAIIVGRWAIRRRAVLKSTLRAQSEFQRPPWPQRIRLHTTPRLARCMTRTRKGTHAR